MKNEPKITLTQWDELSEDGKGKLRTWAVNKGYELDLVPGPSGIFDPVCGYAALLTKEQMMEYLKENKQTVFKNDNSKLLWQHITKLLTKFDK